mgnify:CR=1 FL=1
MDKTYAPVTTAQELTEALAKCRAAQEKFATYTQEQVDKIFLAAATAANQMRIPLAKQAVAETGMGVVEDKVIKNHYAAEYIYNAYKDSKTCGVIEEDTAYGIQRIAEPIGVIAAVIPALLYYWGCAVAVMSQTEIAHVTLMDPKDIPKSREVMKDGWIYLLIIAVLLYCLLVAQYSPLYSALWATCAVPVVMLFDKKKRFTIKTIPSAMVKSGFSAMSIVIGCACAGIVVGMVSITGIGVIFGDMMIQAAHSLLFPSLLFTAITCIVLGMGLPTTAAYVIAASILAPSLIKLGLAPLTAHLFVFYFACLSAITPPVALAAYAGAGIAKTNPMTTAVEACKLGFAGIAKSVKSFNLGRDIVIHLKRSRLFKRSFTGFNRIDNVLLYRIDILCAQAAEEKINLCRANGRSLPFGNYLYTLCRRIGTLVELTGKILDSKNSRLGLRKLIGKNIGLRLGENGFLRIVKQLRIEIFNIIAIENSDIAEIFKLHKRFQIAEKCSRLVGKLGFLFNINTINHYLTSLAFKALCPISRRIYEFSNFIFEALGLVKGIFQSIGNRNGIKNPSAVGHKPAVLLLCTCNYNAVGNFLGNRYRIAFLVGLWISAGRHDDTGGGAVFPLNIQFCKAFLIDSEEDIH